MYYWANQGGELGWLILEDFEIVCQMCKLTLSVLFWGFVEHIPFVYEGLLGFLGGGMSKIIYCRSYHICLKKRAWFGSEMSVGVVLEVLHHTAVWQGCLAGLSETVFFLFK